MKVKASITISKNILEQIDNRINDSYSRSKFIEEAVVYYLKNYQKTIREMNDSKIINSNYKELNKEAEDVLSFQDW
ncbi:MAG TPA: hypothetical protein PLO40_08615 [Spirochaetota bacterium]|nr:hypothetical protein [Spirochaetota bacterium]